MDAEMTEGFKLIMRFFKEFGCYKEFKRFINEAPPYDNISQTDKDPLYALGNSAVTYWMGLHCHTIPEGTAKFYDYFKAWLYTFYPESFDEHAYGIPSNSLLECIDKEKRKINVKLIRW